MMKKREENDAEDAFFKEVSEDIKNENMQKLWDKYGLYIIAVMAIVLTAAVSFETFKSWKVKRNQTWSDTYSYALNLQNQGRYDESKVILDKIQKSNNGIYGDIAKLQTSNILFEQGKNAEALVLLEEIVNDPKANQKMKDMSAIKLASYKLDSAPKEEIITLLAPLSENEGSWKNIAKEMLAMLEIREGNIDGAKNLYQQILDTENLPDGLKLRVQDMLSILNSNQK